MRVFILYGGEIARPFFHSNPGLLEPISPVPSSSEGLLLCPIGIISQCDINVTSVRERRHTDGRVGESLSAFMFKC